MIKNNTIYQKPLKMLDVLHFSFNEDGSFFVIGDKDGFRIYNSNDNNNKPQYYNDTMNVYLVSLNYHSNICAIVGESKIHEGFSKKIVSLWDMAQNRIFKTIEFKKKIRALKFYKKKLLVCTKDTLSIYDYPNMDLVNCFRTFENKQGIFSCSLSEPIVCCYPSLYLGNLTVYFGSHKIEHNLQAHNSSLSQALISNDGKYLFTCSEKGTIIRVFILKPDGIILHKEFKRGSTYATIHSLAISPNNSWLNVTSSTGTGHIYNLNEKNESINKKSVFSGSSWYIPSFLSSLSKQFDYEWSSIEYYGVLPHKSYSYIDNNSNVIIFSVAGFISRYSAKMSKTYDMTMINYNRNIPMIEN